MYPYMSSFLSSCAQHFRAMLLQDFSRICGFQGAFPNFLPPGLPRSGDLFIDSGGHLLSRTVSSAVPSAVLVLTVVFGMGTGVSPARIAARYFNDPLIAGQRHTSASLLRLFSFRKEVIQPHLPIRLPCYDFTPVIGPTFGSSFPCGLGH